MNYASLQSMVEQLGYVALFLCLWLGIFSLPVPNELAVLTGGALAASSILDPVVVFLTVWAGAICGLTFGYTVGRSAGAAVFRKLRNSRLRQPMARAEKLNEKVGGAALILSFFVPVVRHLVPYLNGAGKMPFRRFAGYAYASALVWTVLYFAIGYSAGNHLEPLWDLIMAYGLKLMWLPFAIGLSLLIVKASKLEPRGSVLSSLFCIKRR